VWQSGPISASVLLKRRFAQGGDYPPDIQAGWGPRSKKATRQAILLFIPFLLVGIGALVLSNWRLKKANGGRLTASRPLG